MTIKFLLAVMRQSIVRTRQAHQQLQKLVKVNLLDGSLTAPEDAKSR